MALVVLFRDGSEMVLFRDGSEMLRSFLPFDASSIDGLYVQDTHRRTKQHIILHLTLLLFLLPAVAMHSIMHIFYKRFGGGVWFLFRDMFIRTQKICDGRR